MYRNNSIDHCSGLIQNFSQLLDVPRIQNNLFLSPHPTDSSNKRFDGLRNADTHDQINLRPAALEYQNWSEVEAPCWREILLCCCAVRKNFYKTLNTSVRVAKLSSVMLSVFRVTSLCHTVTLVSRCLPVPGVSRTECHSPGPRSAVLAVSPGPALAVRVWHCSVPGQPPSHCGHVTSSWHGRHQTLASQHRPARAMAASLPRQAALLISGPGSASLVTPGHTWPTLVTGHHRHPMISASTSFSSSYFSFFSNVTCHSLGDRKSRDCHPSRVRDS